MAIFQIKYEIKSSNGTSQGIQGTTVQASSETEARNKVKAKHPSRECRIISCVKKG